MLKRKLFPYLLFVSLLGFSICGVILFCFNQIHLLAITPRPAFAQSSFSSMLPDGENVFGRQFPEIPSVVFHGDRNVKQVALTFDADMTDWMEQQLRSGKVKSYYDYRIPETLEKTDTAATFFLTGEWIEMYPEVTKDLSRNTLFELSSHSYSHPAFHGPCYGLPTIPLSADADQITKTQVLLENVAHVRNKFFRFPGGCYAKENVAAVEKAGLRVVDWDVVGDDAFNSDVKKIEANVLSKVQNGSIIVLHLMGYPNAPATADALPAIITGLREKGYTFVTVADLLHLSALSKRFDYRRYLN